MNPETRGPAQDSFAKTGEARRRYLEAQSARGAGTREEIQNRSEAETLLRNPDTVIGVENTVGEGIMTDASQRWQKEEHQTLAENRQAAEEEADIFSTAEPLEETVSEKPAEQVAPAKPKRRLADMVAGIFGRKSEKPAAQTAKVEPTRKLVDIVKEREAARKALEKDK